MFCPHCNQQVPDGTQFCPYCGQATGAGQQRQVAQPQPPQPPYQQQTPYQQTPLQGTPYTQPYNKAIPALVLGIVGLVFSFLSPIVGIVCGILGVVFGYKSMSSLTKQSPDYNKAKAGFICAIIALPLAVIVWAVSASFSIGLALMGL